LINVASEWCTEEGSGGASAAEGVGPAVEGLRPVLRGRLRWLDNLPIGPAGVPSSSGGVQRNTLLSLSTELGDDVDGWELEDGRIWSEREATLSKGLLSGEEMSESDSGAMEVGWMVVLWLLFVVASLLLVTRLLVAALINAWESEATTKGSSIWLKSMSVGNGCKGSMGTNVLLSKSGCEASDIDGV